MNTLEERVKSLIEQYEERGHTGRHSFDKQFDQILRDGIKEGTYSRLPPNVRGHFEELRTFGPNGQKIKDAEDQVKQLSDLYRNHKVSQEEFEKRYSVITAKDITVKSAYDRISKDLKDGFEGLHTDILRSKTERDMKASIERYVNNVKSYDFKNRFTFDQGYKEIVSRPEYKGVPEDLRKHFEDLYKYGPNKLNVQYTEKKVRAVSDLLRKFPNDPAIQSFFDTFLQFRH